MFVSPTKTTEPAEMPLRWVTWVGTGGLDLPRGRGNFLGLSSSLKSTVSQCCGIRNKNINNNKISITAAADCTAATGINFRPQRTVVPSNAALVKIVIHHLQNFYYTALFCHFRVFTLDSTYPGLALSTWAQYSAASA